MGAARRSRSQALGGRRRPPASRRGSGLHSVDRLVARRHLLDGVLRLHALRAPRTQPLPQPIVWIRIASALAATSSTSNGLTRKPGLAVDDRLGRAAEPRPDDRHAERHRLQVDGRERVQVGREVQERRRGAPGRRGRPRGPGSPGSSPARSGRGPPRAASSVSRNQPLSPRMTSRAVGWAAATWANASTAWFCPLKKCSRPPVTRIGSSPQPCRARARAPSASDEGRIVERQPVRHDLIDVDAVLQRSASASSALTETPRSTYRPSQVRTSGAARREHPVVLATASAVARRSLGSRAARAAARPDRASTCTCCSRTAAHPGRCARPARPTAVPAAARRRRGGRGRSRRGRRPAEAPQHAR